MNPELLVRIQNIDPAPPDDAIPNGVWDAQQVLEEIRRQTENPAVQRPLVRRPWLIAVAAAAAILILIGGIGLLARNQNNTDTPPVIDQIEPEEPPTDPEGEALVDIPQLTKDIPPDVESGALATPLGEARWVHLKGNQDTLPGLHCTQDGACAAGEAMVWPSGFAIFQPSLKVSQFGPPVLPARLWVSADGIEWHIEPLPAGAERLSPDGGVYWLTSESSGRLWRSTDGTTWDEFDPGGLIPPGPAGLGWDVRYWPPVTVGDLTLSYATFSGSFPWPDYVPDYDQNDNPCVDRFRSLGPGVFEMVTDPGDDHCPDKPVLRFEETETGLRVLDDETGAELGEIEGLDLTHIAQIAQTDEVNDHRLLIIGDGEVTPVEVPWPATFNGVKLFATKEWIYAYVEEPGRLSVWRTSDGRSWTDVGPPSLPGTETLGDNTHVQSVPGGLVAFDESNPMAWETTDGINWTPLPEGLPEGTYPIRLESGWIATDGLIGGPPKLDAWWIHVDDTWVSLAELGVERAPGCVKGITAAGHTTFFQGDGSCPPFGPGNDSLDLWILSLER